MRNQDQFNTMMEEQALADEAQVEQDMLQPVEEQDVEEPSLRPDPAIVVKKDETVVFESTLENFPVRIGRKNHNDIVLNEKNVSREHAMIVLKDEQYFIQDLGSTGGTRVNNEPVTEKDIHTGDCIEIGSFQLLFNSGIPEDERTVFDTDDHTILEDGTQMDEDRTLFYEEPVAKLLVLQAGKVKSEHRLEENETVLGRDEEADITVDDKRISRRHCKISLMDGSYMLSDLGSSNGTFVNGRRINEKILEDGDRIQIGSGIFRFCLETPGLPGKSGKRSLAVKIVLGLLAGVTLTVLAIRILPAFRTATPQKVILQKLWEQPVAASVTASPALGDINGDGQTDVITASAGGELFAMDASSGGSVWNGPLDTRGGPLNTSPLLADINESDGQLDVIIATSNQGLWTVDGWTRRLIWNGALDGPASGMPAAADINGDGTADIFVASAQGDLTCFDGRQGGILWQIRFQGSLRTSPRLGDLNRDGSADVLIGTEDNRLYALNGKNSQVLWVYVDTDAPSTAVIGDLNRDKIPDVVIMTASHVIALEGEKGTRLWQWTLPETARPTAKESFRPLPPAIADLNRDKIPDVIISAAGGHVYAVDGASGGEHYLWDYVQSPSLKSAPALADLNRDGVMDVLFGDLDGYLTVVDGTTGHRLNQIDTGGPVAAMPVLADINGNQSADIIVGTTNGRLVAVETESAVKINQIIWNSF